jgi:hypothetical protein
MALHYITYFSLCHSPSNPWLPLDVPRLHSDVPNSVGLLWTSDQPVADPSTWRLTTLNWHTSVLPEGFEPVTPTSERSESYTLYCADNRTFHIYNTVRSSSFPQKLTVPHPARNSPHFMESGHSLQYLQQPVTLSLGLATPIQSLPHPILEDPV